MDLSLPNIPIIFLYSFINNISNTNNKIELLFYDYDNNTQTNERKHKYFVKQIIRVISKRCHPLPKKKNVVFVTNPSEQKTIAQPLVDIPFVSYV